MRILVTGGAGFIGSHLTDRLLDRGFDVYVIDNLSSGNIKNLGKCVSQSNRCRIKICDLKNDDCLFNIDYAPDLIYHLAANPDVRASYQDPQTSFNENILVTFKVLEFMQKRNIKNIIFTSSSTVYGDAIKIPTSEDHPIKPISIYGACKAASEIMIQTYSRLYKINSVILRLANIIGSRTTHGVIYDFINKLRKNPEVLEVLGDGMQKKSYLYIDDTIKAMEMTIDLFNEDVEGLEKVYNLGNEDWITVKEIAEIVIKEMNLGDTKIIYKPYTSDGRGWPGDVKFMLLDIEKIKKELGWRPEKSSREAVAATVKDLLKELFNT